LWIPSQKTTTIVTSILSAFYTNYIIFWNVEIFANFFSSHNFLSTKNTEPSGIFYLLKCKLENQLVIGLAYVEVAKVLGYCRSHPNFMIHKIGHRTIHPLITTFMPIPDLLPPNCQFQLAKGSSCLLPKKKKTPKKRGKKKEINVGDFNM